MRKIAILALVLVFSGCSLRILTFGSESSNIDRDYSLGYVVHEEEEKDDK